MYGISDCYAVTLEFLCLQCSRLHALSDFDDMSEGKALFDYQFILNDFAMAVT